MNLMGGTVVREEDLGATWTLASGSTSPASPAQGDYDLEVEVPRLVYEILEIERDRHWEFSIHRGSIHVLPSVMASPLVAPRTGGPSAGAGSAAG